MTEHQDNRPKKTRYRRPKAELDAPRLLAREAALRGDSLASIRARLQIPEPTLTGWARQDGYRQADLKARAEAEAEARKEMEAARGEGAAEIDAIRQQAGELWALCEEMQDRPTTGARRQVDLARARTLALAEAGFLDAAEEEMAAMIVRQKGLEGVIETARRINEEAEAFYADLREKGRNRDYWSELAELRRREREGETNE